MNRTTRLGMVPSCLLLTLACAVALQGASSEVDTEFLSSPGLEDFDDDDDRDVQEIVILPDGKIVMAGQFDGYNGREIWNIARLMSDGTLDERFELPAGVFGGVSPEGSTIRSILPNPDGSLLIAGSFHWAQNVSRKGVAQLHPDGTLDTDWVADPFFDASFRAARQSDGSIVLYSGHGLERLHPDGSRDDAFPKHHTGVSGLVIDGQDRISLSVPGSPGDKVLRLLPDGSPDTNFPSVTVDGVIRHIDLLPENRLLLSGLFTSVLGQPRFQVAVINEDGTLDADFVPDRKSIPNENDFRAYASPSGGIFVHTAVGGFLREFVTFRLSPEGRLLPWSERSPFLRTHGFVYKMMFQADGKILLGGDFEGFPDRPPQHGIARLLPSSLALSGVSRIGAVSAVTVSGGPLPGLVTLESSTNLVDWAGQGQAERVPFDGARFEIPDEPGQPSRFFRARVE